MRYKSVEMEICVIRGDKSHDKLFKNIFCNVMSLVVVVKEALYSYMYKVCRKLVSYEPVFIFIGDNF